MYGRMTSWDGGQAIHYDEKQEVSRGDIVYVDLRGTWLGGKSGRRPVIVVQSDEGNRTSGETIIVPLTSGKREMSTHVKIPMEYGLREDSIALCESITTIRMRLILNKIGSIAGTPFMDAVEDKIKLALGMGA